MTVKSVNNEILFNKSGIIIFIVNAIYMSVLFLYGDTNILGFAIGLVGLLLMVARYILFNIDLVNERIRSAVKIAVDILILVTLLFSYLPPAILAPTYGMAVVGAFIIYGQKTGTLVLYAAALAYLGGILHEAIILDVRLTIDRLFYILTPIAVVYVILLFFIKAIVSGSLQSSELKKTNEQLNLKVAEFYTLQYIQNSISSIRDTRMLFEAVNDMIIGVIGPTFSSIVLRKNFENGEITAEDFDVWSTNIDEAQINDFIKNDCLILWKRIGTGKGFLCKTSLCELRLFDERLKSVITVPLMIKNQNTGMIIVAHAIEEALNEDFLRLLEVISGNLSIALENTWLYEKMHDLATIDGLTGVYNRMYFNQAVEEEFIKAMNRYPLSIVICDIDHFKSINDNYGHLYGDKILKDLVQIMQSSIRSGDILARFGGEEFAIIFPNADTDQAYMVVERLRQKIEETVFEDKHYSIRTTVSFGIASYPEHGASVRRILKKADEALYLAKREGRNCTRKAYSQEKELLDESLRVGGNQRDR